MRHVGDAGGLFCFPHFLSRALPMAVLTVLAALLSAPMAWMALCAFTPQSELQRAVPMGGTFAALDGATLASPSRLAGWTRAYFTTINFQEPGQGRGLFDITTIPVDEFKKAPVHAWIFGAWDALFDPVSEIRSPKSRVPAGRLILWFENTLFVSVAVTALTVLLNAMAGYAFAKLPFPGQGALFWIVIGTIMIPGQVTLVPLFLLITQGLGWHNSFLAVILPMVAGPVGIFLMKQYIQSLPGAARGRCTHRRLHRDRNLRARDRPAVEAHHCHLGRVHLHRHMESFPVAAGHHRRPERLHA